MSKTPVLILPMCCTCLTNESNGNNGYCINGHDDWVEERDLANLDKMLLPQSKIDIMFKNMNDGNSPDWVLLKPWIKKFAKNLGTNLKGLLNYEFKTVK